ncbi:peptidoglycan D,D-transpeptidase FtsI family protein [Scrofimicrobium sp. R131]|uniref:Penicillin-binding transpeptidase domain-containing protein n=1 Tax=Scrofimicrobium appendicitidis TaxID=3079930 RepID=A0AAU7V9M6_9ACTO
MNAQVRRIFAVALLMFLVLALSLTLIQVVNAPSLKADGRNSRQILQAAERERGAIIVEGNPIAYSERLDDGTERFRRVYPAGGTYAAVTGFFSAVNLYATGMEAAANEVLEGETSELFMQRLRNLFAGRPRQGGGVELTLSAALQQAAADALGDRAGAVVVEDVKTGKILALYSSPTFDPNPLASLDTAVALEADQNLQDDPSRPMNNRAIASDRYAPGSVFKILTATAMLESGLTPDTVVDSPPTMTLPGTETQLSNIEGSYCGSGQVSLREAFARSCNTTFALAVANLPAGKLQQVTKDYGFGAELEIPLEVTPSYFPDELNAAQLATSAIGQFEVAVTPLQMAMVTQAVANGGQMMQPYLVNRTLDADNRERSVTEPEVLATPISAEVAAQLTDMMKAVVSEPYGTGASMALDGVSVAAKTGTAEVGDGSYTNAWSVAFAPADNPQLAVSVIVEGDENNPTPHGGDVAGPIVRKLLEVGLQ